MKILHLTLKKKWFDLILSGKKSEEYRECKPYWKTRLFNKNGFGKRFDIVRFKNGYGNVREMDVEFKKVFLGGEIKGVRIIIIQLGEVLSYDNKKG